MKRFTMLILLLSYLLVLGCAGLAERPYSKGLGHETQLIQKLFKGIYYDLPVSIVENNKIATLYVTEKGRVAFKKDGDVLFLDEDLGSSEQGRGRKPLLLKEGDRFYAVWRVKSRSKGDKYLYFRTSYDSGKTFNPAKVINSENGVLNYSFASDGKGNLMFVYDDERKSINYRIYINISQDYGNTWLEKDIRLDSIPESMPRGNFAVEPEVASNGQTVVVTWKERKAEKGGKAVFYLKSRVSHDGGKSWGKEIVLRSSDQIFTSDNLVFHKGAFYIIGHENYAGITGYKLGDNGLTWVSFDAPRGSEKSVNSQLKVIAGDDYLYAVYTAEKSEDKKKPHIFFTALSLSEGKWSEPVRLDSKEYDLTKSISPDITVLDGGSIVAAWEDYRNIRPNIYINFSGDNGITWKDEPVNIEESGRYFTVSPKLYADGNSLFIFYSRYSDDARKTGQGYLFTRIKDINIVATEGSKGAIDAEKKEKLKKSVNRFWTLRKNRQYADTYEYFDPVYRTIQSKDDFTKYQGNILYHRFKIAETDIKGNIAQVKVELNFEVKETEVMGKKFSMSPKDDILTQDWVWIYDRWYNVYKKPIGRKSFLNY